MTDIQINWLEILGAIIHVRFFEENYGIWKAPHLLKFVKAHNGDHLSIDHPIDSPTSKKVWVKDKEGKAQLVTQEIPPVVCPSFDKTAWEKFYNELSTDDKIDLLVHFKTDLINYFDFPVKISQTGQLLIKFTNVWQIMINGFNCYASDEPEFLVFMNSKGFCEDEDELLAFFETMTPEDQQKALYELKEDWDNTVNEY